MPELHFKGKEFVYNHQDSKLGYARVRGNC